MHNVHYVFTYICVKYCTSAFVCTERAKKPLKTALNDVDECVQYTSGANFIDSLRNNKEGN